MADEGFIHDRTERAINVYVHRITGVSRLDWLNTSAASRVIETLKQWRSRERKAPEELQGANALVTVTMATPMEHKRHKLLSPALPSRSG
jgi:hypothetical protein